MEKIKRIIGSLVDAVCILTIVFLIGYVSFDFLSEKIFVNIENSEKNIVVDEKEVQIFEIIAEKIYNAFIESNIENVNSMMPEFKKLEIDEVKNIANQLKISPKNVDAKAVEIHKLSKNIYRINVIYQDEDNISFKNDGKVHTFVIKLNRRAETFKILEIKVGV